MVNIKIAQLRLQNWKQKYYHREKNILFKHSLNSSNTPLTSLAKEIYTGIGHKETKKERYLTESLILSIITQGQICLELNKYLRQSRSHRNKDRIVKVQNLLASFGYINLHLGYKAFINKIGQKIKGKETVLEFTDKLQRELPKIENCLQDITFSHPLSVQIKDSDKYLLEPKTVFKKRKEFVEYKNAKKWVESFNNFLDNQPYLYLKNDSSIFSLLYPLYTTVYVRCGCEENISYCFYDKIMSKVFDLRNSYIYRVFNHSKLKFGGRFYNKTWQSMSKELRSFLHQDGQKMIELDISNFHPSILFHKKGINLKDDMYKIPGIKRKDAKLAFQVLINSKNNEENYIKAEKTLREKGYNDNEIVILLNKIRVRDHKVRNHFYDIREFFYSGIGLELQRKDSDMTQMILDHFMKKGVPCYPVHDSYLIQEKYKEELYNTMVAKHIQVFGFKPEVH